MANKRSRVIADPNPLWYKDAVIYELHVRTFYDCNGDGVGDFPGLAQKLDYLQDLGITAVWLLPFYPSPLRDDGYDIANYVDVNPIYGTLKDFQFFLDQAHLRGIRVIIELALNHTSDQHAWFQRARKAKPGSVYRDYYVWSNNPQQYRQARIIFPDYERSNWTWDDEAQAYYWHRFYASQPDLNYDNPRVRQEMFKVVDFWFQMGVDGLRLDAVPYLYEREGTSCENLPETHAFLRELRQHVDSRFTGRMLLAEANQWPEDAVAYFGQGDECHMAFHFPLMPRLFMALYMEDRFPIVDILEQTPPIPDNCQWATFLRNHDELTLEMVTDEERDYMYRVYATDPQARINLGIRRRLAPLLGNHRRRMELLHALLFALPGTPVLYYGNEIGMGDNIYLGDRDGVRTPFQWSGDRNAGFSRANPQKLCLPVVVDPEYHYEAVNVEAQRLNPYSLWHWTRRLVELRRRTRAFGRGELEFLHPDNAKVLAFIRRYQDESVLVLANLSRYVQGVTLDLAGFAGTLPKELFGQIEFPRITEEPYFLSLGPHGFYFFALVPEPAGQAPVDHHQVPDLQVPSGHWESLVTGAERSHLEAALPAYVQRARWYGGKARRIKSIRITDAVALADADRPSQYLLVTQVAFNDGGTDAYLVGAAVAPVGSTLPESVRSSRAIMAQVQGPDGNPIGMLYDALADPAMAERLAAIIAGRYRPDSRRLRAQSVRAARETFAGPLPAHVIGAEQSNTSVVLGDRVMLKIYRRLQPGPHPDWEIGQYLTETGWPHVPAALGVIEYRVDGAEPMALAFLQQFVVNQGDAWHYVRNYLEELQRQWSIEVDSGGRPPGTESTLMLDGFWTQMERLGMRLGELHTVLSQPGKKHAAFIPESFSDLDRRSLYQTMRSQGLRSLTLLQSRIGTLSPHDQLLAVQVLDQQSAILAELHAVLEERELGLRIRCHGDFHLGQVLVAAEDFVLMDFEGEPARTIPERRIKRSPLRDVAGMIRSLHYAMAVFARDQGEGQTYPLRGQEWLWGWYQRATASFWDGYLRQVEPIHLLPPDPVSRLRFLHAHLLEKALYELVYELNQRPDLASVPLQGILSLVRDTSSLAGVPEAQA